MLVHRLATGIALVVVVVLALVLDEGLAPWYPLWLVLTTVVTGATALEVVGLLDKTSAKPSGNTVFGGSLVLIAANWAPHVLGGVLHQPSAPEIALVGPIHALAWPLWAFAALVMFAFIAQSAQFTAPGRTMATIAGTILALAYVGLLGSFLIQMRWLPGPRHGMIAVLTLLAAAKGSDTGAYALGRIAGKHKLWPRLSPNKTIEGALGGVLFGVAASLIIVGLARYGLNVVTLGWPETIGFGLLVSSFAQLGDLMESMIKRDCDMKDASATLPGFGGVLDVMDSLLFAGPVAYGYWMLFSA